MPAPHIPAMRRPLSRLILPMLCATLAPIAPLVPIPALAADTAVPAAFTDAAARADVVALGERHDHAGHHRIQAAAYRALIAAGHRPALVMEMFSRDSQTAIDALTADLGSSPTPAAVDEALDRMPEVSGFTAGGWSDWSAYRPVVAVALEHGLPVLAADWPMADRRALSQDGWQALPADFVAGFGLDQPAAPAVVDGLTAAITAGHCGHAPEAALPAMIRVQRARDAGIAGAALDGLARPGVDQALIIAGSGHVRRDLGAPLYLGDAAVLAVGLAETGADDPEPGLRDRRPDEPFDLVWVAEAQPREDPCIAFKAALEAMNTAPK